MATLIQASRISSKTHRVPVKEYLKMIATGVIPQDARVELLDGILVEQMTKYAPHTYCVSETVETFRRLLPVAWVVREEKPLILGRSWRPEPDVAIVRGPKSLYRSKDPETPDVVLLVEVADSSYATDRGEKWRAYAAARIPIYWIVDLNRSQIEVFSDPLGRGKGARYREASTFGIGAEVPVVIDARDVGRVAVKDILS